MILESSGWMQVLLVDVWVSVIDFREWWVDASVIS